MKTRRVQADVALVRNGDDQDEGSYTSTESDSSRIEGQVETEPRESSQQQHHDEQEKPLTFKRTITRDSLCLILANLHPCDGLKVLCLCCSIRSLAGKELWEWWALALWPEKLVLPSVPRLYPDFEALVRDDNRRGAILTLKWPDVGNDQTVCLYTGNRPTYYFACRVLAVEYDRHQSLLSVHFDVRGEGDLVQPGYARLFLLGPKTLEIASPIPHRVCRLTAGSESYIAVPVPSVLGVATLAAYPPAIGLWTFENNLEVAWSRSVKGKRCTGHVTFHVKRFDERLRLSPGSSTSTLNMTGFEERQRVAPRSSTSTFNMTSFEERQRVAPGSSTSTFNMTRFRERQRIAPLYCSANDGAPLQLKFVYSMDPSYTPVTLAEWPASKRLSVTEALTEHSCHGPEIGMHATGEMSGLVNVSGVGGVVGAAKERFDFVPDSVKLKPEWWA